MEHSDVINLCVVSCVVEFNMKFYHLQLRCKPMACMPKMARANFWNMEKQKFHFEIHSKILSGT